jgi:hypothetical protein
LYQFLRGGALTNTDPSGLQAKGAAPKGRTDAECCKAAEECQRPDVKPHVAQNAGLTICCDGRRVGCVFRIDPKKKLPFSEQVVVDCRGTHEKYHVGHPGKTPACPMEIPSLSLPQWPNRDEMEKGECEAWTVEIECYITNGLKKVDDIKDAGDRVTDQLKSRHS